MKRKLPRPLDRTRDEMLGIVDARFGVQVRRIKQRVHGRDVILCRMETPMPQVPITKPLHHLIYESSEQYQGPAFIPEISDEWTRTWQHSVPIFNCHAYSLGTRVGLAPNDWVEGEPTDLSMNTNPTAILLAAYFRQIRTLETAQVAKLVEDQRLCEGDIISFTRERNYWGTVHEHSGKVLKVEGKNWMMSKFMAGRLLVTPIADALELYPKARTLRAYRFLGTF